MVISAIVSVPGNAVFSHERSKDVWCLQKESRAFDDDFMVNAHPVGDDGGTSAIRGIVVWAR